MDERKKALLEIIKKTGNDNDIKAEQLIDEIIFLEKQLQELKKLPFLRVNPKNRAIQEETAASRQYAKLEPKYVDALRLLFRLTGDLNGETEEESPLRQWAKARKEKE